jgi:tetratricopeptide (TPR) repeat protein
VKVGRPPDSVAANLAVSRELAIEEVLSARGLGDWYGVSRHAFYAKAWALVHMLRIGSVDDPARVRKLNTYLRRFGRDQDEGASLAAVLGIEPGELGRRLDRYIAEGAFRELAIPGADAAASDPALRIRALSETEANFQLFELAERLGTRHHDKARVLLDRVLELDPDHARALANLGFLDREVREPEETARLLERAVGLAPSDPAIRNLLGRYLLERAEQFAAEIAESEADIEASINARLMRQQSVIMARTHLAQSVALAPESAEGHYWLGVASLVDSDHYRLGRRSLEKARELAPWSAEVSLRLAELNLRIGHPFRARRLLESVVGSAHSPDQAERARELLEDLGPRRGRKTSESERD